MEGRSGLYIVLVIAVLVFIAAIAFYFFRSPLIASPEATISSLKDCNTLEFNSEEAINLVFFSTETQAQNYKDFLMQITPFKENQEKFNTYYITSDSFPATEHCELYKGIATLCYNKEILTAAASCPVDFITVLDERPSQIRSSAYHNVMSLNLASPLSVFAHEIAHALANLAEEYDAKQNPPRGSLNCQASCEDFDEYGEKDGCFQECSKSSLHRTHESSFMRSLRSSTFGIFNENLIIQKIEESVAEKSSSKISGNAIFSSDSNECRNERYYLLEISKQSGTLEVLDAQLKTGCAPGSLTSGGLEYNVYNDNGGIISTNELGSQIFTDVQESGQDIISGEVFEAETFFIAVPTVGGSIEIIDGDSTITFSLAGVGENTPCPK